MTPYKGWFEREMTPMRGKIRDRKINKFHHKKTKNGFIIAHFYTVFLVSKCFIKPN